MSWLVALDLTDPGTGPMQFGQWLRQHWADVPLTGLHVIEEESEELRARAERALRAATVEAGMEDQFQDLQVLTGPSVEDAIHSACVQHPTEGLVLGREAGTGSAGWVRLGTITRRLLRRLPIPTIVVPPDLVLQHIGDGPIILATDATASSLAAARFALRVGQATGRPVVAALVMPPAKMWSARYFTPDLVAEARHQQHEIGKKLLAAWCEEHGIEARQVVLQGDVLARVFQLAADRAAPLIVCGTRRPNAVERFFAGNLSNDLAAYARRPVAIIPPIE